MKGSAIVAVAAMVLLCAFAPSRADAASRALGRVDPLCNGGGGLHLAAPTSTLGSGTTAASRGAQLVPVSVVETSVGLNLLTFYTANALYDLGPYVTYAVSPRCTIDRSFATNGHLAPTIPGVPRADDVYLVRPGPHGAFYVAAGYRQSWRVGAFTADGALNPSFGVGGWVTLVPPGGNAAFTAQVTDLAVESNGDVLLLGDNAQTHASNQVYLYALRANGSLDQTFGDGGHLTLFSPMTYAGTLLVQPNGSAAVTGEYGGAGCYDMPVEWVTPNGTVEAATDANYVEAKPFASTGPAFWGATFLDPSGGMGIVGLRSACDSSTSRVTSVIQELNPDGSLDQQFARGGTATVATPNPKDFNFSAATLANGHLVVESYDYASDLVNLRDFTASGDAVRVFGNDGLIQISLPSLSTTYTGPSNVARGPRGDLAIAVPNGKGLTFEELVG